MPPKKSAGGKDDGLAAEERLTRIAIVSADRCRPKKCRHECKKSCPVVKIGAPRPPR
jgi:ATP-binding cassette subfamily E protein 1